MGSETCKPILLGFALLFDGEEITYKLENILGAPHASNHLGVFCKAMHHVLVWVEISEVTAKYKCIITSLVIDNTVNINGVPFFGRGTFIGLTGVGKVSLKNKFAMKEDLVGWNLMDVPHIS